MELINLKEQSDYNGQFHFMSGQPMSIDFQKLQTKVIRMLSRQIPPMFSYHNVKHTLDVLEQCQRIAWGEGVTNEDELMQLRIAALYHDTGFLSVYQNHEEKSCQLLKQEFNGNGYDSNFVETICSLIMATKIPQTPRNRLEQIICDADLDYLGRDDFESISNCLKKELFDFGFVKTEEEWATLQIKFIEGHNYFTRTAQETRTPKKKKNLEKLKLQAAAIISTKPL